jgi:elongation factor 3
MTADLIAKLADKKTALEGLQGFEALFGEADAKAKISLCSHLEKILDACADKQKPVAQQAISLAQNMFASATPWSGGYMLKFLKPSLSPKAKPEVKAIACDIVTAFAKKYPESLSLEIEWLVHPLSILMNDIKKEVKDKAKTAMTHVASCSGNKDLEKFGSTIVKAQESAKNVPDCVEELAGCIFVQNVEAPALAVLTPVLVRGLNERTDTTKRRCCVIVDNMCKLIDDPREGSPLMAEVRDLVFKATESIADPEAREVSEKAYQAINKLVEAGAFVEQDFKAFAGKHGVSLEGFGVQGNRVNC